MESAATPPKAEPLSVNVQTGIRWASLGTSARFTAIKGQIKGGGASNPHGTTNSLAKRYLAGGLGKRQALKAAKSVSDRSKRHEVRVLLKNLIRMVPNVSGTSRPLPPLRIRTGPSGIVKLKVTAQLFLEDREDRYIGFWPNEVALDYKNARLYAQFMRESVAASESKPTVFEIYDLKRSCLFAFQVDDLDDDTSDLRDFFSKIEGDIRRARLH